MAPDIPEHLQKLIPEGYELTPVPHAAAAGTSKRMSPDGGPPCNHKFRQQRTPVRRVRVKETGSISVVNLEDFNPELHEELNSPPREQLSKEDLEVTSVFGREERGELVTLTLEALKQKPEFKMIPEGKRKILTRKDDVVDSILAVRAANPATE